MHAYKPPRQLVVLVKNVLEELSEISDTHKLMLATMGGEEVLGQELLGHFKTDVVV